MHGQQNIKKKQVPVTEWRSASSQKSKDLNCFDVET